VLKGSTLPLDQQSHMHQVGFYYTDYRDAQPGEEREREEEEKEDR